MGARLIGALRNNKIISDTESGFMLNAASTTGPLFLTGSVALGMLNDPGVSSILIASHYISAFITAFLNGLIYKNISDTVHPIKKEPSGLRKRLGGILNESVTGSINGMLSILGFMVLFGTAAEMLEACGLFTLFSAPNSTQIKALVCGFFELASGCLSASALPRPDALILISFFCGFGGISVICQSTALGGTNVCLVLSKLFQGSLSSLLTMIFTGTKPTYLISMIICMIFAAIAATITLKKRYHLSLFAFKRLTFSLRRSRLSL